ncbi:MAG: hypothetical protein K6357_02300 [Elusimicrobiota bacterium]
MNIITLLGIERLTIFATAIFWTDEIMEKTSENYLVLIIILFAFGLLYHLLFYFIGKVKKINFDYFRTLWGAPEYKEYVKKNRVKVLFATVVSVILAVLFSRLNFNVFLRYFLLMIIMSFIGYFAFKPDKQLNS